MTRWHCWFPENPRDGSFPPEGYEEWAAPDGLCNHEHCAEGNRIGRLYASERRVRGMSRDDIEALKADHELIADEYGGWMKDEGGYILVAEVAD